MFTSITFIAQTININPDKTGEPWLLGGLRIPSQEEFEKIPVLVIPEYYKTNRLSLPTSLDNSTNIHFRPIFNQSHGSCAQSSGIAYTFTYEMNRLRGTAANISTNQYPSHYTYNFLNKGDGANGSWYMDGWDIIEANGCPNISTYGGLASSPSHWMSGFGKYESSMGDRVTDYFKLSVNTPDGLENLKYWLNEHLDGSTIGGIANFAAGASGEFTMISGNKIIEWGHDVNHAMTIVGWDDNIEYDFNGDGNITNNIDINGDGVVDMKDWEKGALIMVNSWGTGWGIGGKAYIMYKLLAEPYTNGGIYNGVVYGIHVKEAVNPQLTLKVKMTHNSRNRIKLRSGISTNLSDSEPEHYIDFPLFSFQGGDFYMCGSGNSNPIEISLDISSLLTYVDDNDTSKVFLVVEEVDPSNSGSGEIIDFSIVDGEGNEFFYTPHNEPIINNGFTYLSIDAALDFDAPNIDTSSLPNASVNVAYSENLSASGGNAPYQWKIIQNYTEESLSGSFPAIDTTKLDPTDNDDGFATQVLDFDFPFYGENYNTIYLNTDGSIIFEPIFDYIRDEDAIKANKVISVFAYDLLIDASYQGIFYEGDANSATFRWKTTLYGNTSERVGVAVTLYPDGKINCYYGDNISTGLDWASGISDGKGSYIINSFSGENDPSNMRVQFKMDDFPIGMTISNNGEFSGTLTENGSWNILFKVTDYNNVSKIKSINFSTSSASVDDIELSNFSLFPNPVKGILQIDYSLYKESNINISIYNLSGQLIDTIVNDTLPAGQKTFFWNTENYQGFYFAKIRYNNNLKTYKILVE
jgi:hypothetical protein